MPKFAPIFSLRPRVQNRKTGFTLIELLVLIAIIIILLLIAFIAIKPFELQKEGRDSIRVGDLTSLNQAIQSAVEAAPLATHPLCNGSTGACSGDSSIGGEGAKSNQGSGWVKVNLSNPSLKLPQLKLDPSNTGSLKYQYASDGTDWELNTQLESVKYQTNMLQDGGNSPTQYEVGTRRDLIP